MLVKTGGGFEGVGCFGGKGLFVTWMFEGDGRGRVRERGNVACGRDVFRRDDGGRWVVWRRKVGDCCRELFWEGWSGDVRSKARLWWQVRPLNCLGW